MTAFGGFSDRAVEFYAELAADNSKEFWAGHKAVYESEVRDPMRALVAELEPDFGPATVFRPHRDIRFSKDKTPYKTAQGAVLGTGPGIGYYVQLDARGLLAGGGYHSHGPDQVARYREAVDREVTGTALAGILAELREGGFEIGGPQLKTRPRGFDADHPRIELLRYTSLTAVRTFGTPAWLASRKVLDVVRATWRGVAGLAGWIASNVGPPT